jgi:hypothetical protein
LKIICEWCFNETRTYKDARFVVVTGRSDTMVVKEYFICTFHADELTTRFRNTTRGMMGGATFDDWELHWMTEKAREFYIERDAERIAERIAAAIKRSPGMPGNLPYKVQKPNPGGVQRGRWVYRDQGKIWQSLPVY